MSGPQGEATIGDGSFGVEAALNQFQQADPPGVGVAMLFLTQEIAVGGIGSDADQDGISGLEDLVVQANADSRQIGLSVVALDQGHGAVEDIEDRAHGEVLVEEVPEQFDDPPEGAMADQSEGQNELSNPGLGDGEVKEDLVLGRCGLEGLLEGLLGLVGLLVGEFAADIVLLCQFGDGLSGEGVEGELLALGWGEEGCRGRRRRGGRGGEYLGRGGSKG